jgi:hypothetical protein
VTTQTISTGLNGHTSMVIGVDGLPMISSQDTGNQDLRITRCFLPDCSSAQTTTLEPTNSVGFDSSITIGADGLPFIAHYNQSDGDLRVYSCGTISCNPRFEPGQ